MVATLRSSDHSRLHDLRDAVGDRLMLTNALSPMRVIDTLGDRVEPARPASPTTNRTGQSRSCPHAWVFSGGSRRWIGDVRHDRTDSPGG